MKKSEAIEKIMKYLGVDEEVALNTLTFFEKDLGMQGNWLLEKKLRIAASKEESEVLQGKQCLICTKIRFDGSVCQVCGSYHSSWVMVLKEDYEEKGE